MSNQYHPYHLVDNSPWPAIASLGVLGITVGSVMYFNAHIFGDVILSLGLLVVILSMYVWWRDVVREGTFQGHHTIIVQRGLKYGVILFIVSEVLFFFSFFWAYFHSSLAPAIEIGGIWPPTGIEGINPFGVPLLNTALLLTSGATVTWAHHAIVENNRKESLVGLLLTILLGIIFTGVQGYEYYEAGFDISSAVYGSTFFLATGFHGFHVIVGTIFLLVTWVRLYKHHLTSQHHLGFESAAYYWHFVDVVWLFLFVSIYYWGYNN
jgi:cytochrome c oxidase subunit 3